MVEWVADKALDDSKMEKVLEYFDQELHKADDNLTRLSVITALLSFLKTEMKGEVKNSASDLMECLGEILSDGLDLDESDLCNLEKCDLEKDTKPRSDKTDLNTDQSCPESKEKTECPRNRSSLEKLCEKKKSNLHSVETVEKHLKLMTLKSIYELTGNPHTSISVVEKSSGNSKANLKVQKSTLFTLAAFLNSEKNKSNKELFKFSPNFVRCVQKYIASKDNKIRVQVMSEKKYSLLNFSSLKEWLQIYEPDIGEHFEGIFGKDSQLLSLAIVSDSHEDDLSDILISQQVAWRRTIIDNKGGCSGGSKRKKSNDRKQESKAEVGKEMTSGIEEHEIGEKSCDVEVTKVLNGNLLWVNVGKVSIQNVERIHLMLKEDLPILKHCKSCKENDIVAAVVCEQPRTQIIRGKVLCVRSGLVRLFALDIGALYNVPRSSLFCLPPELTISEMPGQAVMAYLHDVYPTPVDPCCVEVAAASLTNMCRSPQVARAVVQLKLLDSMPTLMSCGDHAIVQQVLRLATNITRHLRARCCEAWLNVMFTTLELINILVKKYMEIEEMGQHQEMPSSVSSVPSPQTSTPKQHSPSKGHNKEKEAKKKDDMALISLALLLLSNLLHNNQAIKEIFYQQKGLETVLICQRMLGKDKNILKKTMRLLSSFVHDNDYLKSQIKLTGGRSNTGEAVMSEVCNVVIEGDADENIYDDDSEDDINNSLEWEETDNTDSEDDRGPVQGACSNGNGFSAGKDFFIKGSSFPLANDPRCELLQGLDLCVNSLCVFVCGMLNSGQEGTICVGISKDGEVRGEKITHSKRDEFRLGIDEIMCLLVPPIMHFQLQMRFIPVIEAAFSGNKDAVKDTDYFVIEIVCKPMAGLIHTVRNGQCYYRTGRKTVVVNEQGIRHLIILDEEEKYSEEIINLQRKLETLTSSEMVDSPFGMH